MHQRIAVQVVHEEVAVGAELHPPQHRERLQAQQRVVAGVRAARFVQRGDGARREVDIMLELDFLARQIGGFDRRMLRAREHRGLLPHAEADRRDRHEERHDREQEDLEFQSHRDRYPSMGACAARVRQAARGDASSIVRRVGRAPPSMMSRASLVFVSSPGLAHAGE